MQTAFNPQSGPDQLNLKLAEQSTQVSTHSLFKAAGIQSSMTEIMLLGAVLVVPLVIASALSARKKQQAVAMRQRIERLEKIWRLNYRETRS